MSDCQTFHYDQGRLGQGDGASVGSSWHKKIAVTLGSAVRGAPLYLQGWVIQEGPHAGETHNIVYVATSDNHVNAYAEDQLIAGNTTPLWTVYLGPAVTRTGSNIPPPSVFAVRPYWIPETSGCLCAPTRTQVAESVFTRCTRSIWIPERPSRVRR